MSSPKSQCRINVPLKLDSERPEYHRSILTWRETPGTCGEFAADSTGIQKFTAIKHAGFLGSIMFTTRQCCLNPGRLYPLC